MPCFRHTADTARTLASDTGCPPPELLVTVSMQTGIFSRPTSAMSFSSAADVHVALEGVPVLRLPPFRNHQVDRLRAGELDVGPGGVEVGVVGHHVARLAERREEDPLGGAALVGREHLAEAEDVLHRRQEAEPGAAAGVGLVAAHDRRPLLRAHRRRAAVGQEVDEDVLRLEQEDVVGRLAAGAPRARPAS